MDERHLFGSPRRARQRSEERRVGKEWRSQGHTRYWRDWSSDVCSSDLDRANGQTGFFDNMTDRPILSDRWRAYEIVGAIEPDADALNIGLMLLYEGKIWMKDISLEVLDGQGKDRKSVV